MNSNRNRTVSNYNRGNTSNNGNGSTNTNANATTNTNNTYGSSNNGNRRFNPNNNPQQQQQQQQSRNVGGPNNTHHTVASAPTRNAWGVNSINASVTGISSLSSSRSASASSVVATKAYSSTPSPQNELDAQKHMFDRVLFLLAKSIGLHAIATVASGARYRGILQAASAENEIGIVMAFPEKFAAAPGEEEDDFAGDHEKLERMIFLPKDLVDIEIESPDLSVEKATSTSNNGPVVSSKFKTDTDISGKDNVIKERDLQRWQDDGADSSVGLLLEDSTNGTHWDQFAANEKFGVQSTYDEHYYTTAINRDVPDFKERERRALQIASEIESSSHGGNIHIAEERGLVVDDSGMDEEDKYSGVQRQAQVGPLRGNNKYTPPAYRAPTNKPNNRGIPYDPAIVTSQLANNHANNGEAKASSAAPVSSTPSKSPALDHHLHTPVSHAGGKSTPISALFGSSSETSAQPGSPKKAADAPSTPTAPASKTTPLPPSVALSTSRQGKFLDKEKPAANNVGDVTKDLAGNFKQFVDTEVEKVQQKKQYLQSKEKSDRIKQFKEFSQTYKINSPVPVDLAPLLGKKHTTEAQKTATPTTPAADRTDAKSSGASSKSSSATSSATLSEAIADAHATKKAVEVPSPLPPTQPKLAAKAEPEKTTSTPTPPSSAPNASPSRSSTTSAKPSPAPVPKLNLNFKAPEFRPNPAAHSFTPSFNSSPGTNNATTSQSGHSSPYIGNSSPVGQNHPGGHPAHAHNNHSNHAPRARGSGNPFFGSKPLSAKPLGNKFNLFVRIYEEHVNAEEKEAAAAPLIIEKAFVTPPTWSSPAEDSYTKLVPSREIVSARASGALTGGNMVPLGGGVVPVGGMGGFGGIAGAPFYGRTPMVANASLPPNLGGPGMIPVLQDPRLMSSSPQMHSQVGFMGYPQYPGAGPQYNGGGPAPQFYRPPQPFPIPNMMGQLGGYMGFQPQDYHPGPHHHQPHPSHHQSPRGPAPQLNQQFSGGSGAPLPGYFSPQQQHQYLRSPGPHHANNRHRGGGQGEH